MELTDKIENLYKKRPFIYEVNDDFYYIGNGIFEKCTDQISIYRYTQYDKIADDDSQSNECIKLYRKIRLDSKIRADLNMQNKKIIDDSKLIKIIFEFINSLTAEQKNTLQRQLNNYIKYNRLMKNVIN